MTIRQPIIGDWYRNPDGALFEVVAYDDDDGTIEIQFFDGTIEELERDDWNAQWKEGTIETGEAPEDWSGSVDALDRSAAKARERAHIHPVCEHYEARVEF